MMKKVPKKHKLYYDLEKHLYEYDGDYYLEFIFQFYKNGEYIVDWHRRENVNVLCMQFFRLEEYEEMVEKEAIAFIKNYLEK